MAHARTLINADRASLFIMDHNEFEIWTKVAEGTGGGEIRIPLKVRKNAQSTGYTYSRVDYTTVTHVRGRTRIWPLD